MFDVDAHPFDHLLAHVVPGQLFLPVFGILTHRANESHPPLAFQWEDGEKLALVQADVYIAVHRRSPTFHVRNIKEMVVVPAWESDLQRLAYDGMCAVAPSNVGCLARLRCSIDSFQASNNVIVRFLEG